MESAINKFERMLQLELLLLSHPKGLRKAEIARRLGVHRSTIGRYIDELSTRLPLWERENKIGIERSKALESLSTSIYECLCFHLAANALAAQLQIHNPDIASGIRKLAHALQSLAPVISDELLSSADIIDGASKERDAAYVQHLKTLTRAWMARKTVSIRIKKSRSVNAWNERFLPESIRFLNPQPYDNPLVVAGKWEGDTQTTTIKVRDIDSVEILDS